MKAYLKDHLDDFLKEAMNASPKNEKDLIEEEERKKYEKEKRQLELQEMEAEITHKKKTQKYALATLAATVFSAVVSFFSLFAQPTPKPETIILLSEERKDVPQKDPNIIYSPSDPPYLRAILKRANYKFPQLEKTWAVARESLEQGKDPFEVQKFIVNDLKKINAVTAGQYWKGLFTAEEKKDNSVKDLIRVFESRPITFEIKDK